MKLCSVETTPSPNCIKLNLDQEISAKALTLQASNTNSPDSPEVARQLQNIAGIKSVFLFRNFITLTKENSAEWQPILTQAASLLGKGKDPDIVVSSIKTQLEQPTQEQSATSQNLGQVEVALQVFRGIPVQVRVTAEGEQARVALPERFSQALQRAIAASNADYVAERRWQPYEPRFGNPEEVAQMVADEIDSAIDTAELARRETAAVANGPAKQFQAHASQQELLTELQHPEWGRRLKAIQALEVNPQTLSAVAAALNDEHSAVRRWAAAILGASGMPEAVEPLCRSLRCDNSVVVRRTAGDALSDLGDTRAIATMCQALTDRSKLVRWRAARFLNEIGDETAVPPLRRAEQQESEFDVRLEMQAASERISGGGETQLPMWMRISGGSI